MGPGFMGMMKGFMEKFTEKLGGKDECQKMKKEWCQAMKEGSDEQKAEQWKKFGEKMSELGDHMKNFTPEEGENWDAGCTVGGKDYRTDRAKIVSKPEGILQASPGTTLIEEIEILNDTYWPWKPNCSFTLADE